MKLYLFQAEHGVIPGMHQKLFASVADANVAAAEAVNEMLTYCRETYDCEGAQWLSDATSDNWPERFGTIENAADAIDESMETLSDDWLTAYVEVTELNVIGETAPADPVDPPADSAKAHAIQLLNALQAFAEAYCPPDGSPLSWEDCNFAYAGALRVLARVHGQNPESDQPSTTNA